MATNTLTDSQCRGFKPGDKGYKKFDGEGLYLWITPGGSKLWRQAYRWEGKEQTISWGPYPQVSLAEARAKRDQAKRQLRDGINPMAAAAAPKPAALTFSKCAELYWAGRKDCTPKYIDNATRAIDAYLVPALGQRPIDGITRNDLLAELRKVDDAGKHVYVRKIRLWADAVFEWARANGHCDHNPAAEIDPKKAFAVAKVEHFAALEPSEMPQLFDRLSFESPQQQSVLALRMLAYTWVRTTELRQMRWHEIEGDTWRIPAGKMKRSRDHVIPLSRQALELIEVMRQRARGSDYVFRGESRNDTPISENAILYLLYRIGFKGRMTGHGFRSVASTWANEAGYEPDHIELQLAHSEENKTRSAYNRARYLKQRRQMLQDWADWLDACAKPAQ